jgi:hypothetical protein
MELYENIFTYNLYHCFTCYEENNLFYFRFWVKTSIEKATKWCQRVNQVTWEIVTVADQWKLVK